MLSPAMQGVILAIAKARQTFDRDGSEAGLVKVSHCLLNPLVRRSAPSACGSVWCQRVTSPEGVFVPFFS